MNRRLASLLCGTWACLGCSQPEPFAREGELTFMPANPEPEPEPVPEPTVEPEPVAAEPVPVPEPTTPVGPNPSPTFLPVDPMPGPELDAASPVDPPPEPPAVTSVSPEQSHWGAVVTVTGTDLGDAADADALLTVGENWATAPGDDTHVLTWTPTRIEVRVPFPEQGEVTVTTRGGTTPAGTFHSNWALGTPYAGPDAELASSLSALPGTVALAFESDPPRLARFDGEQWTETVLEPPTVLLGESLHLYATASGELAAFGLTEERELVTFPATGDFAVVPSGLLVNDPAALAGGPDGGVVWHLGASGWERLRAGDDGWVSVGGPVADPGESLPDRDVAATSSGSLIVGYSRDTGNFLDDLGAPYFYKLSDDASEFEPATRGGSSVDDYLTSLSLVERGRGFLIEYCGSDVDPFAVTGTDYRCYTAAHSDRGDFLLGSPRERDGARHAFTRIGIALAYCDADDQLRLTRDDRAVDPGEIVTWPCVDPAVLEVDPNDEAVLMVRYQSEIVPLHYVGEPPTPSEGDAGAPMTSDGGLVPDAGSDAGM